MITRNTLFLAILGSLALGGCAAKTHVLIGQTFIAEDKSIKLLMTVPTGKDKDKVTNQYMRVCTLQDTKEVACKDTLILTDVRPGSLY
jgi:hypothetical protein